MPHYLLECVDRETGEGRQLGLVADTDDDAVRRAGDMGYVVARVSRDRAHETEELRRLIAASPPRKPVFRVVTLRGRGAVIAGLSMLALAVVVSIGWTAFNRTPGMPSPYEIEREVGVWVVGEPTPSALRGRPLDAVALTTDAGRRGHNPEYAVYLDRNATPLGFVARIIDVPTEKDPGIANDLLSYHLIKIGDFRVEATLDDPNVAAREQFDALMEINRRFFGSAPLLPGDMDASPVKDGDEEHWVCRHDGRLVEYIRTSIAGTRSHLWIIRPQQW